MGFVVEGHCEGCAYHVLLHLGAGLRDCNEETILSELPAEVQANLIEQREQAEIGRLSIERKLAACTWCRKLMAIPVVQFSTVQGEDGQAVGICSACGRPPHWILDTFSIEHPVLCPRCGKLISLKKIGFWD